MKRLRFEMTIGPVAGLNEGIMLYRSWVNCDDTGIPFQCSADGCGQTVLYDCFYCDEHLRSECGVYIAPSQTGFGMGLFTAKCFRKGESIAHYGGELISDDELCNRYCWVTNDNGEYISVTAPYALEASKGTIDAVRIRGAGAYCNCPKGTSKRSNAYLGADDIRAWTNIRKNTEVFVSYGRAYWLNCGPKFASHQTTEECFHTNETETPLKKRKI
jgi:hypothetical protein